MSFKHFLLNEVNPMGGMGAPPAPPMSGMGMPPPPPGGDPMAGGMGGPPGLGGGMGGAPPMGGPMGGAAPGAVQPQVPLQMKVSDVWSVLSELLQGKDSKDQSFSKKQNLVQPAQDKKHLMS